MRSLNATVPLDEVLGTHRVVIESAEVFPSEAPTAGPSPTAEANHLIER
jgi:hypothetical protein